MEEYLIHSGILGMKWGVRRYQYEDGSLTPEGKIRYAKAQEKLNKKYGVSNSPKESSDPNRPNYSSRSMITKPMDEMTTEELRNINTRITVEQQYYKNTHVPTVKEKTKTFLKEKGNMLIKGTGKLAASYTVSRLLERELGSKTAEQVLKNYEGFNYINKFEKKRDDNKDDSNKKGEGKNNKK